MNGKAKSVYLLVNPSDQITFETEHEEALIAGVLMLCSNGLIALERVKDAELVLPALAVLPEADSRAYLAEKFGEDFKAFLHQNVAAIGEAVGSILYGSPTDRKLFDAACNGKTPEEIRAFREKWNDEKRTSMSDYSRAFLAYSDKFKSIDQKVV